MNRRTFLCGLTLGTLVAPFAGQAEQAGKVPRVGALALHSREQLAHIVDGVESGLRDQGWVPGRNIVRRWDHSRPPKLKTSRDPGLVARGRIPIVSIVKA